MELRVIWLPPFKAAASVLSPDCDFSDEGALGKFNAYFSAITPSPRDDFRPRDFLYYDDERKGMVWMYALAEGIPDGGNEILDFEGGYYVTYAYKDGDGEAHERLWKLAMEEIKASEFYELDIRPGHYAMGHIITPHELVVAQGWGQMETFIPVRMKKK